MELLLLLLLWKPIYYLVMMVYHTLRPNTVGAPADQYVGKIVSWFKDLIGLVSPVSL